MPATVSHAYSATTPPDFAYELHMGRWNEDHALTLNLAGSEVSGAFSNGGNVSFALETNGRITASANVTAAPSPVNISAGTTSNNLQTVVFSNSNGVSFGLNGSTITASHNGLTTQTVQTQNLVSVLGSTGNISFANGNGITFGGNASTITASHNGLTTARASNDAIGLNTAQSNVTWTVNSAGLSLDARGYAGTGTSVTGGAAVTLNSNGLQFNGTSLAGTSTGFSGTNVSASLTLNTAGIALQLSAGAGGAGDGGVGISAGANSVSAGTVVFSNSNGVSFGLNGSTVTASHNGLTSQSNQAVSAANGSYAFQTLSFSNANGISFGTSAGSAITASHNALTTARASNDAIGLNTAQTNVTWTVNSAGLSLNAAGYAGTGTSATNASITLNSNGLAISVGAGGGVTPVASASNGSFSFTTIAFSNANNVTFGTSAGSIITASVAAPGAAAENNAINLLGANTAGNTTATGSTIGWSGINLTLSGTNNSVVNISAPATSSLVGVSGVSISTNGSTISVFDGRTRSHWWDPDPTDTPLLLSAATNNSVSFKFVELNEYFSATNLRVLFSVSGATHTSASTNTYGLSVQAGIYTRNGSTISLASSGSQSYSGTWSTNGTASINGVRAISLPFTINASPGEYWMALRVSTSSSNASMGLSGYMGNISTAYLAPGAFGAATNTSQLMIPFFGMYSATSGAVPNSVTLNQVLGTGTQGSRGNFFHEFRNQTVI